MGVKRIEAEPSTLVVELRSRRPHHHRHAARLSRARRLRRDAGQQRVAVEGGGRAAAQGARRRPRGQACWSSTPAKVIGRICRMRRATRSSAASRRSASARPVRWDAFWSAASPVTTSFPELYPAAGRAGDRQARQGRVLPDRPGTDAEEPRDRHAVRLRRHHRGLRQHHRARSQRPRLPLHRAVGLLRVLFPGIPRRRARP